MARTNARVLLIAKLYACTAAVLVAGVLAMALTPLTVSWSLTRYQAFELAGWTLGVLAADGLILWFIFLRPGAARPRLTARRDSALTARELEVVRLVAEGLSTKEIAQRLVLSPKTVDAHRAHILRKLGLHDRVSLTRHAIRQGWVDLG